MTETTLKNVTGFISSKVGYSWEHKKQNSVCSNRCDILMSEMMIKSAFEHVKSAFQLLTESLPNFQQLDLG